MTRRPWGPYRIGLADPPWHYQDRNRAAGRELKYRTTPTEVLARLDVSSLFARDAALFVWSTGPMFPDALQLLQAWGFAYSTVAFTWLKVRTTGQARRRAEDTIVERFGAGGPEDRANARAIVAELDAEGLLLPALHVGQGQSTRANQEFVLMGFRGRLDRVGAGVRQPVIAPLGEHSAKPIEVHQRIVQLLGDRPRLELFARARAEGWHAWGDQVPGGNDVEIDLLPDPAAPAPAEPDVRQTTIFELLEAM